MKNKIIEFLKNNQDKYVSGEEISNILGVTRAAVWKHIKSLKDMGYNIESAPKKGYKLVMSPDILTYNEIKEYLKTEFVGRDIYYFDELDSTNSYAKSIAEQLEGEGQVVITEKQVNGRGRLGRQWVSQNNKGIWMSIILKPKIDIYDVSKITQVAAASVNKAINDLDVNSLIKWPNDIIIDNKKVCGILTEMNSEINIINYIVVGIGINVNHNKSDFSEEIKDVATSVKIHNNCNNVKRNELVARILNYFEDYYNEFVSGNFNVSLNICKENSYVLNKYINIIKNDKITVAKAIDINDNGELVVEYNDGNIGTILSGEVSVRLKK